MIIRITELYLFYNIGVKVHDFKILTATVIDSQLVKYFNNIVNCH